jgi:cell division protein FtsB
MAVYEGARPRSTFFPRRRLEATLLRPQAPVIPRRRQRTMIRANRRPRTVGLVICGIVVVFVLSFFSLAQTVRVSVSSYDMDNLDKQYNQLQNQRQQLLSDIDRLGRESAIRRQAIAGGLSQLPAPIVLPAR